MEALPPLAGSAGSEKVPTPQGKRAFASARGERREEQSGSASLLPCGTHQVSPSVLKKQGQPRGTWLWLPPCGCISAAGAGVANTSTEIKVRWRQARAGRKVQGEQQGGRSSILGGLAVCVHIRMHNHLFSSFLSDFSHFMFRLAGNTDRSE